MTSARYRIHSPFVLSILFSLLLGLWWGSSQLAAPGPNANSSSFAPISQQQNERSSAQPQQTCTYTLSPAQTSVAVAGGTGSFSVATANGCAWMASASASWITITTGGSGTGNGTVQFRVAANTDSGARRGLITVANQTFTIEQGGTGGNCTITTINAGQTVSGILRAGDCVSRVRTGGTFYASRYTFTVAAASLVALSVSSTDFETYLYLYSGAETVIAQNGQSGGNARIPAGSGYLRTPGSGTFTIEVTSLLPGRTGAFTLSLFIAPTGCDISALSATSAFFEPGGGSGSVQVATANGCPWIVEGNLPWVTISTARAGAGSMTVRFDVAANANNTVRRGALTIAGKTFNLEQAGMGGSCNPAPLTPGQLINGSLSQADCSLRRNGSSSSGESADYYSFNVTAGQRVAVYVFSTAFTPRLALADVGGSVLIESGPRLPDGNGYFTIPVTGPYTIEVARVSGSSPTGGYNLILAVLPAGCGYALGASDQVFNEMGGPASVSLAAGSGCAWTAVSPVDWITVGTASGSGSGTINFTLAANVTNRARVGAVLIAGQVLTIEQAGTGGTCPAMALMSGQTVRGNITPADCRSRYRTGSFGTPYQAELYSFSAQVGEQVLLTAAVSTSFSSTLSVADASGTLLSQVTAQTQSFTAPASGTYFVEVAAELINQFTDLPYTLSLSVTPPGCSYRVSPTNQYFEAAGGAGSLNVNTGQGCPWMASANVEWITFNAAGGTGSGATSFTVAANTTNMARIGRINLAGQSVTVAQAGTGGSCSTQVIAPGQPVNGALTVADCRARSRSGEGLSYADRYTFNSTAGQQVRLIASANVGLYLLSPSGAVLASANSRLPAEGGFITLPADGDYVIEVDTQTPGSGGISYTLTLLVTPSGCGFLVAPLIQTFDETGGSGSFNVITGMNCPWLVSDVPSWVMLTPAASGAGSGVVNFSVAPNTTNMRRRVVLEVNGATFGIEQAGAGGTCGIRPITPGQVISGALNRADCQPNLQFAINYITERFSFNAVAGDQLAVLGITNPGFVKGITLLDPTGGVFAETGAQRLPANGFYTLPVSGMYVIELSSGGNENLSYILSVILAPATCAFTVFPTSQLFEAAGGTGSITINSGAGCPWWAVNTANWITIDSGANGNGDGAVAFTVAPNTSNTRRRASIYLGGQEVIIDQAGTTGVCQITPIAIGQTINERLTVGDCRPRFGLSSDPYVADRYSFNYTAEQQVTITANPSAFPSRLFLSDANGTLIAQGTSRLPAGNGFLTLPASGTYFIEVTTDRFVFASDNFTYGLTLSAPTSCAYTLVQALQRFDDSGGAGNVTLVTGAGCAWTAQTNADWITVNAGAGGTGPGTVNFTVAGNMPSTWRTGTITIGGQTFTIEQAGFGGNCTVQPITPGLTVNGTLTPADCRTQQVQPSELVFVDRYTFEAMAGDQAYVSLQGLTPPGSLGQTFSPRYNLLAPNGQSLMRSSSDPRGNDFLLTLPTSGSYLIEVTSSSVGDYALQLMRAAGRCAFRVTPATRVVDLSGGTGSFDVATSSGCEWAVAVNFGADWLTINSGATGSGSGQVAFTAAPNTNRDTRRADLIIAGQFVTVQQTAGGASCTTSPLSYGQTVRSDIGTSACRSVGYPNAAGARQYIFTAAVGDRIALQAAAEFPPLLTLLDSRGMVLAQAEGPRLPAGTGFITLPASGVYTIEIAARATSVLDSYSLTLIGPAPGCSYAITSSTRLFEAAGGTGSVTVNTGGNCLWTATSSVSWITLSNSSGSGPGVVNFTVSPSTTVNTRQTTLTVAGQSLTITQAGVGGMCTQMPIVPGQAVFGTVNQADCLARDRYFFNAMAGQQAVVAAGLFPVGNTSFQAELALFAPDGTTMARGTATTNTVRLPQSGGSLTLPADGTYVIEIARGQFGGGDYRLSLTLAPATCRYTISPSAQTFEETGGTGSISVSADAGCAWEAISNVNWITINAGASGMGNGTVSFTVAANTGTLARTGTLTVAGRTFTLEQAGRDGTCTIRPLAPGQTVTGTFSSGDCNIRGGNRGDRYSFNGTAGDLVALQATTGQSQFTSATVTYLYGPSGALLASTDRSPRLPAGTGYFRVPATGTYLVEIGPNTTGTTGTYQLSLITVQPGCGFTLSPVSRRFETSGGRGSFNITTGSNCPWTLSSDAPWITINGATNGTGSGAVNFTVAANSTTRARIGRLTVGSETFIIEQAGAGGTCAPLPLTPGQTVSGTVTDADCRSALRPYAPFISEQIADNYTFTGNAGDRAVISVTPQSSSSFFISLIAPNGEVVAENVGTRLPPGIGTFVLPVSGTYLIDLATNGGIGSAYTLMLTLAPACAFQVEPLVITVPAIGGGGVIRITGVDSCDWLAASSADWLSIVAANSLGSGNGMVSYTAASNPGSSPRVTVLNIAGQPVTVRQAGAIVTVSAASLRAVEAAAEALVATYGVGLASTTQSATAPVTTLAGTTVKVRDSAGTTRDALLLFISPTQVNYQIPPGTVTGRATITITSGDGTVNTGFVQIVPVAPGLFAANANGSGVAAAVVLRMKADGTRTFEPVARYDDVQRQFVPVPVDLGAETDQIVLLLYGTGLRNRSALTSVSVQIGGIGAPPTYAGAQGDFVGLDQINVPLPRSLAGRGEVEIALTVDGQAANVVRISIK